MADIFDEIAASAPDAYQTPAAGIPAFSGGGDIFDHIASTTPEPSFMSNVGGDIAALPGGLMQTAASVPSGLSNLLNSVVKPVDSIYNGTTEKALRGTGTLAAMLAGGGVGAETGAGLGLLTGPLAPVASPVLGILGGAIGAAGGYMGFNDLNQLTGSDAPTTAAQDMSAFRRNVVQGTILGGLGEGVAAGGSKLIGPQTEAGAMSTVGNALEKYVNPTELTDAIKATKNTPMGGMQTSAEVLKSPELAIMEQQLGSSADGAMPYATAKAQRGDAAQFILDQISQAKNLSTEDSGLAAQGAAVAAEKLSKSAVNDLYDAIPKDTVAKIYPLKMAVNDAVDTFFGPGAPPVPANLKSTINFITDADNKNQLPIGDLQRARSHALDVSRSAYRAGNNQEGALASSIASAIKDTIEKAPEGATEWQAANSAMREHAAKFRDDPLSSIADLLPSKVINKIMSSPESAKQFTEMVNGEPKALGTIKDQLVSDLADMTDAQRVRFIDKNDSQLQTLLGNDFQYLDAVRNDIRSRIDTQKLANATAGSNTALKLSGVIEKALTGKNKPVAEGGLWDKLIKGIATGTGITAAYTHPLVTLPAVAAAAGVKALRNRSGSLIQKVLGQSLMHPEVLKQALATESPGISSLFASVPQAALAGNNKQEKPLTERKLTTLLQKTTGKGGDMDTTKTKIEFPATKTSAMEVIKSDPYLKTLAQFESNMDPKAKNPDSSAKGLFQFIDSTAKNLGVKDAYDVDQSLEGIQKLTKENIDRFGSDPVVLYSAHYLGANVLNKLISGQKLTAKEASQVEYLKTKLLPKFRKMYLKNAGGVETA